ncbi:MAG: sigma-70 family RNA polymerase sigma factor [Planctomycetota bacterium]|jgi:RNA polymerase sigma-70 factor (ECF subfamily)
MSESTNALDPQLLLVHTRSLRAIARALLRHEPDVDDVLQDTWLAALRARPETDRPLGGWLATVTRNFALMRLRGLHRQRTHESRHRTRAPEHPPEVVERFEMQRLVADAIADLDEPYRTTILLRYFENLTPTEIARRTDVPPGTVRSRLKRGLDQLRARLVKEHGGDRRACLIAIAGVVGLAKAGTGPVLAKVAVAAAIVAVVGFGVWYGRVERQNAEPVPRAATVANRIDGEPEPVPGETPNEIAARRLPPIEGHVYGPAGFGFAGARVWLTRDRTSKPGVLGETVTDGNGRFRLETTEPGPFVVAAKADGLVWVRARIGYQRCGIELFAERAELRTGTVIDEDGAPVVGARVQLHGLPASAVLTDREGKYALEDPQFTLIEVAHPDYFPALSNVGSRTVLVRGAILEGTVETHDGSAPVAEALVTIFRRGTHSARTDSAGRFRIRHSLRDPAEQYGMRVDAGALGIREIDSIPWTPGYPLRIVLEPTRVLTGRVVMLDGAAPVPDAVVEAEPRGVPRWRIPAGGAMSGRTDAKGTFRIVGASRAGLALTVRHPDLYVARGPRNNGIPRGDTAEPIEFFMAPRMTLACRVSSPVGDPVPGAMVVLTGAGGEVSLDNLRHAKGVAMTDVGGFVEWVWPPLRQSRIYNEEYELVVVRPGFETARSDSFPFRAGGRREFEMRLADASARAQIFGRVTDPQGRGIAGAYVHDIVSGADGRFCLRWSADRPKPESISCSAKGYITQHARELPNEGELRFAMRPSHMFKGRIVDRLGVPVADAWTGRKPWRQGGTSVRTRTDGSFEFDDQAPGEYHLMLAPHLVPLHPKYTVPASGVVEFVVDREPAPKPQPKPSQSGPPLTIEGRVVDKDGRPFPMGTPIKVSAGSPTTYSRREATCDLEGRFSLRYLKAGRYDIAVTERGGEVFDTMKNVRAGETGVVIRPVETGTITGTVVSETGAPLPRVMVYAVAGAEDRPRPHNNSPRWAGVSGYSDRNGQFRIPKVRRGTYVLVAYHEKHRVAYAPDTDWQQSNVRMVMDAGHTLRGRIERPDGLALAGRGFSVRVWDPAGFVRFTWKKDGSTFAVHGLEPGTCKVTVIAPPDLQATVEKVGTDRTDLVVRLRVAPKKKNENESN